MKRKYTLIDRLSWLKEYSWFPGVLMIPVMTLYAAVKCEDIREALAMHFLSYFVATAIAVLLEWALEKLIDRLEGQNTGEQQ